MNGLTVKKVKVKGSLLDTLLQRDTFNTEARAVFSVNEIDLLKMKTGIQLKDNHGNFWTTKSWTNLKPGLLVVASLESPRPTLNLDVQTLDIEEKI